MAGYFRDGPKALAFCLALGCGKPDDERTTPAESSTDTSTGSTSGSTQSTPNDTEDDAWPDPPTCVPSAPVGAWEPLPPMIESRSRTSTTYAANGDLVVIGGSTCSGREATPVAAVERLDLRTWSWSPLAPLPTPRVHHHALALADGGILVVGGSLENVVVRAIERYDPASDTWSTVGSLPDSAGSSDPVIVSSEGQLVLKPETAPAWLVSDDEGATWVELPHESHSLPYIYRPSLLALPDARVLATSPWGATVLDPRSGVWSDLNQGHNWIGGAVQLGNEVLAMRAEPTHYQAPVGSFQLEPVASWFDADGGEPIGAGFIDCPPTHGKLNSLAVDLVRMGDDRAAATLDNWLLVWFDRDLGWQRMPQPPEEDLVDHYAGLDDGTLVRVAAHESQGPCVTVDALRWTPDGNE